MAQGEEKKKEEKRFEKKRDEESTKMDNDVEEVNVEGKSGARERKQRVITKGEREGEITEMFSSKEEWLDSPKLQPAS